MDVYIKTARSLGGNVYNTWASAPVQTSTSIFGTLVALFMVASFVQGIVRYLWPGNVQIYCHSETGSWALVTGASDGIGYAFSAELLSRGFNVLLHGRNPEKLARVQAELAKQYSKRTVDIVVADASAQDDKYSLVRQKVESLPGKLTVLVNNIGGIPTYPQYAPLTDTSHEHIDVQININSRFTTHLTKALLPTLKANTPSIVLNFGSTGALVGMPYIVTYASNKSYIHNFNRSLKAEILAEGITGLSVLGFIIGNCSSAGNKYDMPLTTTAQECARSCLDRVGSSTSLVYGHWKHAIAAWPMDRLPEWLLLKMTVPEMSKRREADRKYL